MASCPKCGAHLKRRHGKASCKRCGPLPTKQPPNPFGSCFDAAAINFVKNAEPTALMCHGIGISNHPDSLGERIAHAWIEMDHPTHGRIAIDPIWLVATYATAYREKFKVELVITYTIQEFIALWKIRNYSGPWDERIRQYTKEGKKIA